MQKHIPEEILTPAQTWWQELISACPDLSRYKSKKPRVVDGLILAAGISYFVAEACRKNPEMLLDLIESGDLERVYDKGDYEGQVRKMPGPFDDEASLGRALRGIRQREMVRIAIRDLAGWADFFESTADLSRLATACVDGALTLLHTRLEERFGTPVDASGNPMGMVVFAMGKLGARELNFSSDIDLLFAFPENGSTRGTDTSTDALDFFTRLSRSFLKVFDSRGGEGNLFRVDLRLRPFGENGPLILSFNAMEDYYVSQGREWERYALIKARAIAGDLKAGQTFLARISPFIYRRYLDYGVFDALREMKSMIEAEVRRKGLENNVKLGSGGIREIEFFAQVFQLIRGGVEPYLRKRELLEVLAVLEQQAVIEAETGRDLKEAYIFLRLAENRIQAMDDRQTHDLPGDAQLQLKLATAMGYDTWNTFIKELKHHRSRVRTHFNSLLDSGDAQEDNDDDQDLAALWEDRLLRDMQITVIEHAGYKDADHCLRMLDYLKNDPGTRALSHNGRKRLDRLMPVLLAETGRSRDPDRALVRLVDLIKTIERRTSYISLLIENPLVLENLVTLANESSWLVTFLSAHPLLLDELIDIRQLSSPLSKEDLVSRITRQIGQVDPDDLEQMMEKLTVFKLTQTLKVAVAEVMGLYSLMKVSDSLCYLAETLLDKVMGMAWAFLTDKHGFPPAYSERKDTGGFAVIGYGKLGGLELGYGSDLDLVFLYDKGDGMTDGTAATELSHFYARMGQRMMHLLSTHTRAGKMYDIDMRLRPSGSSGPIVSSITAYGSYLNTQAWTFELQALVRSRAVCGDPDLVQKFETLRADVLCLPRDSEILNKDIRTMRERLSQEHGKKTQGQFHLKHDEGGMVDIEFLVQYLVLTYACQHRSIVCYSDNIRQLEALAQTGVITPEIKEFLVEVYLAYRKEVHRLDLQEKPSLVPDSLFQAERAGVRQVWEDYFK